MIKYECLVWTGEQGQQLKAQVSVHSLKSHCALLVSCASGTNLESQLCRFHRPTLFLRGSAAILSVSSLNCHASSRQTGILLRHIVHSDLENKAVSKDLAIVSLQTQRGSLVYCSLQCTSSVPHTGHTVHELHSAGLGWNPLPEPCTYGHRSWLPFFSM